MIIEEIKNIKSDKNELRKFGWQVGGVVAIIGAVLYFLDSSIFYYFVYIGAFLILTGLLIPIVLYPIQKLWMTIAVLLGFVMTRVILSFLFYIIVTPIGLIARLFGKDFLDVKIDKSKASYWNYRGKKDYQKIETERQF